MKHWMKELGDKLNTNKKKIALIAGLIILFAAATCLIELLVFNYQPLFHPSETVELDLRDETENAGVRMYEGISIDVQAELEADTRAYRIDERQEMKGITNARAKYHAICFELKNPAYYKKFRLNFKNLKVNKSYYMDINYINEYGEKETYSTKDKVYAMLDYGVTNIDRKVSSITVYIPQSIKNKVKSIELTSTVKFNKYRMVCIFTCLIVVFMLLFGKKVFTKRMDLLVLVWGLLFGICFLMSQGINENSWDEHVHFDAVYQLASGDTYTRTSTIKRMQNRLQKLLYSTNEERYAITEYLNDKYADKENAKVLPSRPMGYRDILYMPQILTTKLAIRQNWSFETLCLAAKGISLLIYVVFLWWIVYKAKIYKLLFAIVGLMPINLYVAASFSYNMFSLVFHLAGFMVWLNIMCDKEEYLTWKNTLLMLIFFGLGSLSKPMYIILALLILLIPDYKYKNPKFRKYLLWTVIVGGIAGVLLVGIPVLKSLLAAGSMPGDLRGGNTDVVVQLTHVLKHPFTFAKMLIRDMIKTATEFLLNTESYLKFGRFYALEGNFPIYISVLVLGITFLSHSENGGEYRLAKKDRIGILVVLFLLAAAIWGSMYLVYTPQGETSFITGVQGRYYAPLLVPLMACCRSDKITWKTKELTYNKVFFGILAALTLYVIYFEMMKPFCF